MSRSDCSLLDQPLVLKFLFYPRRDFQPGRTDDRDVFFHVAEGIRLGGRLHVARKDSPVVLLFHGNGEIASDYDTIAPLYTRMGASILIVDYRGYGKSDGTPTASALLEDAMATFHGLHEVLSDHNLDDSRVFLMGRSLGSAAALEIAARVGDKITGLIIESGFASARSLIERLGGPLPMQLLGGVDGFDNVRKIRSVKVPTLIIHGEEDQIIPVDNGKTLYESCGTAQKRLIIVSAAGHNDLLYWGQDIYFSAIREFIFG